MRGIFVRVVLALIAAALFAASFISVALSLWSLSAAPWPWQATHSAEQRLTQIYEHEKVILTIVFIGSCLFVLGGVFLLRRALIRPLQRIIEMVHRGDTSALMHFEASDELGRLSRGIIGMTQRMDDDQERMRSQLQKLQVAHEQLELTGRKLIRSERLAVTGVVAAGIAHEIGNPLAVLSGYTQMLRGDELSPSERAQALERIDRELKRMQQTINQLLNFSRTASDDGVGDAREALRYVTNLLAPHERLRGMSLTLPELASPLPVRIDSSALTQVLINLVFNAADALRTHEGESSSEPMICIEVRKEPVLDFLIVEVHDSGPGLQDDAASRVFEPFYTTKPAGAGTGLGLAVCEQIMAAAGGDIRASNSKWLSGACFSVYVPVLTDRAQ